MTYARDFAVHGLVVRAPLALHACVVEDKPVDVLVTEAELDPIADSAELLLRHEHPAGMTTAAYTNADGSISMEFRGFARFRIDDHHVTMQSLGDRRHAQILLEGWVMAMLLFHRDRPALHGSAVAHESGSWVLVGNSGSGKSTLAALLCREGASLITDDVASIEATDGVAAVRRGTTSIRLREPAFTIAEEVPGEVTTTVDGRLSLAPDAIHELDAQPIDAVLIPCPDRSADRVEVTWLQPAKAARELLLRPRIYAWQTDRARRAEFQHAMCVATASRVGLLRVPWGPPWSRDLSSQMAASLLEGAGH